MLGLSTISLSLMVLRVCAGLTQNVTGVDDHVSITKVVVSNSATKVPPPTRVLHGTTKGGHQFVGEDGYLSEFHGSHLTHLQPRRVTVINPNNWAIHHTTYNDYLQTPVPGIHICDQIKFKGNCVYQQVIANPGVCQQLPAGKTQKVGSFLIEKDIQCAFHSDKNCQGLHTWGNYAWPMVEELRAKWDGLNGDILAYKCRKCDGCDEINMPDWDGQSTLELQPVGAQGWIISKDPTGHLTNVGVIHNGHGA